jgi:rSAM/selenodomain-associated transferase 2
MRANSASSLGVVIPTLNAAATLPQCMAALDEGLAALSIGVLVVDGGSRDGTAELARGLGATVMSSAAGRGTQLAAGASASRGDWLLFLHADTVLAKGWSIAAARFMAAAENARRAAAFRFALDDEGPAARRIEAFVAWRCRALGLAYGDQGLLVSRRFYDEIGGFRAIPLMEDVDIVRRVGRDRMVVLDTPAATSAARYRAQGYATRGLRNLSCVSLYFAGVPPGLLARLYG